MPKEYSDNRMVFVMEKESFIQIDEKYLKTAIWNSPVKTSALARGATLS